MKKSHKKQYLFALLPFVILIGLFEIIPIISVVIRSFTPDDGTIGITLDHYIRIFSTHLYRSAIINSLVIAIFSSVIGLVVSFFGAKAAYEKGGVAKKIFMSILNMVSNFSGVPLAFAYIIMLGNTGVLTLIGQKYGIGFLAEFPLYSVVGLMITYIYFQIPLSMLLLLPAFESIKKEWKDAVGLLGGSSLTFWLKVGIPVLMPSILGTFSTMFANAIAAYATAYALVMNNVSILPIRISEQFVGDVVQNPHLGGALAVILIILMILSILMNEKILQGNRRRKTGYAK